MGDDTNWLKKNPVTNPFKLSLKRSSRFYSHDLDGTITTHEDKSKNEVLVVPHIPRKSNIPIEIIKQMDFKIPGPVLKKTAVKRPVTRMNKFPMNPSPRPSKNFKPHNQKLKKSNVKVRETNSSLLNLSVASTNMTERKVPENNSSHTSFQNTQDLSIISWSNVISQSTPKDEATLRSILKMKEFTESSSTPNFPECKKLKAVKRVNFNCISRGNENMTEEQSKANESFIPVRSQTPKTSDKELLNDTGEDSTVAFSCSFKPIVYEDKNENTVADKRDEPNVETSEKKRKNSDSGIVISGIVEMWSAYRRNFNEIWSQLKSNDEEFINILKSVEENDFQKSFSVYETKKYGLYEKLKVLEVDFKEKIKSKIDMRKPFENYIETKEGIHKEIRELDENFEKMLHKVIKKYLGEEFNDEKENKEAPERNDSAGRKKEEDNEKGSQVSAILRRRNFRRSSSRSNTPENSATKRRKLSRKVESQIKILFKE